MMRVAALFLLWLLAAFPARAAADDPQHQVVYFYRSYCEACTPEEDFAAQFRAITGTALSDCDFTAWNVVRADGQAALERACATLGIEKASLPMAVVDGVAYQGAGEMNADLSEVALRWHNTLDSEILFFYVPACESCDIAEAALDALPESVEVARGSRQIESAVRVRRVDISAAPAYAEAMFEAYAVPDDARVAPIAFYADRYLSGADAITARLAAEVRLGWAVGGIPEPEVAAPDSDPLSLAQSIGAGLVAGLNTCALSMLLLFVSLVLKSGKSAVGPVIAFLCAKLLCYLLIGFALLRLMQRLNPVWLRPTARWIMTILGGALCAVTISDAVRAARSDLGGIRNQLPGGLRGGLRKVIQKMTAARVLVPASFALGLIVAGGEFLCAGQLYLMRLMAAAQSDTAGAATLVAYCLAFLAPSAAVCALVVAGGSQLWAAAFFARHMALIKLLTAAAMLGLIVAAWIL